MSDWSKEEALIELSSLIDEIQKLVYYQSGSAEHTRWLAKTFRFLENVFGTVSSYYLALQRLRWYHVGSVVAPLWDMEKATNEKNQQAYVRSLDTAKGLLQAAFDELESTSLDKVYQSPYKSSESSGIIKVLKITEQKLRKVIREKPSNEREVQDAFENLLIGADLDFSRETDSIEYSSKKYIPDFTISKLNLAIEIKFSSRVEREKEFIGQINDDILAYRQKYGNIIFVVYDVGFIRDVDSFSRHFEENDGVIVRVVKH